MSQGRQTGPPMRFAASRRRLSYLDEASPGAELGLPRNIELRDANARVSEKA